MLSVHNTGTGDPWPDSGQNANIAITDDAGTDTVIMRIDKDTDIDGSPEPTGDFDVTGVCAQYDPTSPYDSGYQIMPRWRADIVETGPSGPYYTRGDANASGGKPNVVDASYVLSHLLPNPTFPCQRTADADGNQGVNIVDASYILSHILPNPNFPPPNWPDTCQNEPSDTLPCDSFPPCGWYSVKHKVLRGDAMIMDNGYRAVVKLGPVTESADGWYEIPVIIESSVPFAAYQVELRVDGEADILVTDRGTASESFDFFDNYVGDSKVMIVGLKEFALSEGGVAKGYLNAGSYVVARIRMKKPLSIKPVDAVLADIYGHDIFPELKLGVAEGQQLPKTFALFQNIPNPFSGNTVIKYALPRDVNVELTVYNIAGQKVRTLVNGRQSAGYKAVGWDGKDDAGRRVSPGVYFVKMTADKFQATRKLTVLR